MTNFEHYVNNLTEENFIDSMILNCDGCPAANICELDGIIDGLECRDKLEEWCEETYN